jgi:hypothetical protein
MKADFILFLRMKADFINSLSITHTIHWNAMFDWLLVLLILVSGTTVI